MSINFGGSEARLKCPHCAVTFKSEWSEVNLGPDADGIWEIRQTTCTACDRLIVVLRQYTKRQRGIAPAAAIPPQLKAERMVWPTPIARSPAPPGVPKFLSDDYVEACAVLPDSAKASAALSRRCLQSLLLEKGGAKKKDLTDQIQEVLDRASLQ